MVSKWSTYVSVFNYSAGVTKRILQMVFLSVFLKSDLALRGGGGFLGASVSSHSGGSVVEGGSIWSNSIYWRVWTTLDQVCIPDI